MSHNLRHGPRIDLLREQRISLTALAKREDVHVSTVWRWCLRGVRSVRLECINIGQRRFTTLPAFERWIAAINGEPVSRNETPRQRERAIERAERRAEKLGV